MRRIESWPGSCVSRVCTDNPAHPDMKMILTIYQFILLLFGFEFVCASFTGSFIFCFFFWRSASPGWLDRAISVGRHSPIFLTHACVSRTWMSRSMRITKQTKRTDKFGNKASSVTKIGKRATRTWARRQTSACREWHGHVDECQIYMSHRRKKIKLDKQLNGIATNYDVVAPFDSGDWLTLWRWVGK